jgi:hypothetical protein
MTLQKDAPPPLKPHQNVAFRKAIQAVTAHLDAETGKTHSIRQLSRRFEFNHRRLYDVINVFTAIGCATRRGIDGLEWHGRDHALDFLKRASSDLESQNPDKTLNDLFPTRNCVALPALTVSLVLLFGAMQVDTLDLRQASSFFSRETAKYKSTLCKLYQITLVLAAIEVIQRTGNDCEVKLQPPFSDGLAEADQPNPMALDKLLNRPGKPGDVAANRQAEYRRYFRASSRPS